MTTSMFDVCVGTITRPAARSQTSRIVRRFSFFRIWHYRSCPGCGDIVSADGWHFAQQCVEFHFLEECFESGAGSKGLTSACSRSSFIFRFTSNARQVAAHIGRIPCSFRICLSSDSPPDRDFDRSHPVCRIFQVVRSQSFHPRLLRRGYYRMYLRQWLCNPPPGLARTPSFLMTSCIGDIGLVIACEIHRCAFIDQLQQVTVTGDYLYAQALFRGDLCNRAKYIVCFDSRPFRGVGC